jgi:hypothetical protein
LLFEKAWLFNLLEENQAEIKMEGDNVTVPIRPFEILTIRLRTAPKTEPESEK